MWKDGGLWKKLKMNKGKIQGGMQLGVYDGKKKYTAVYLGRFQPVHYGHLEVIKHMKKMYGNDFHILVGKANGVSERNPFDAEVMRQRLLAAAKLDGKYASILPDLTDETDNSKAWSEYLYKACKEVAGDNGIVFMCGAKDIEKTVEWFEDYDDVVISPLDVGITTSATEVRETYNKLVAMTPAVEKFRATNTIITVSGTTGVGKTTLIQKLQDHGLSTQPEFNVMSHEFVCSMTTADFDDEGNQSMIAGMKFAHMVGTQGDIYERGLEDNLLFFDNDKFPVATKNNLILQRELENKFNVVKIIIHKPWEDVKAQIKGRGRPNEQSDDALEFYRELWEKHDRWFNETQGRDGYIHVEDNCDANVEKIIKLIK